MPRQTDLKTTTTGYNRAADELEYDLMSDDDFETDDLIDDEDGVLPDEEDVTVPAGNVPVWRLIEMSRENRFLERELADFEDYDSYSDDFREGYAAH